MGITCGTAHLSKSEKNRSGLVKRTMNREGDGEKLERAGSGGTTLASELMDSRARTAGAGPAFLQPPCRFTTSNSAARVDFVSNERTNCTATSEK